MGRGRSSENSNLTPKSVEAPDHALIFSRAFHLRVRARNRLPYQYSIFLYHDSCFEFNNS